MSDGADLAELIRKARNGDQNAMEELVKQYEPHLKRIIRFKLTNARLRRFMDSLDVCQSVLGTFFAQLFDGKFETASPKQLASLLALMAQHKVIDRARKHDPNRHQVEVVGGEALDALACDKNPSPLSEIANHDLVDVVRHHLSPENQQVLDLWLNGIGWDEISKRFTLGAEALRKRLNRDIDRAALKLGLLESSQ